MPVVSRRRGRGGRGGTMRFLAAPLRHPRRRGVKGQVTKRSAPFAFVELPRARSLATPRMMAPRAAQKDQAVRDQLGAAAPRSPTSGQHWEMHRPACCFNLFLL